MTKITKHDNIKSCQGCEAAGTLTYLVAVQTGTTTLVWQVLIKLGIYIPEDQTISLLGIYPPNMKTCVHTKM